MDDPLSALRDYNIENKIDKIIESDGKIIFGNLAWNKGAKSNYQKSRSNKDGSKEYYTLESLLCLLRNVKSSHPVYIKKAQKANIPAVGRPDRKAVLSYLNGETNTDEAIDPEAAIENPAQIQNDVEEKTDENLEEKDNSENIDPSSNLDLKDKNKTKRNKFDEDYFTEYLQNCNGLKEQKFKGKLQMTLVKVDNLMVGHVVAAKALDTFSDLAIAKWIKPGSIRLTPKYKEQMALYQSLVEYLLQVDGEEEFSKWESLLNGTEYILPSDKEGWANIFGTLPELCHKILAEVDTESEIDSNGDNKVSVEPLNECEPVQSSTSEENEKAEDPDVDPDQEIAMKLNKNQDEDEIHTLFDLDEDKIDDVAEDTKEKEKLEIMVDSVNPDIDESEDEELNPLIDLEEDMMEDDIDEEAKESLEKNIDSEDLDKISTSVEIKNVAKSEDEELNPLIDLEEDMMEDEIDEETKESLEKNIDSEDLDKTSTSVELKNVAKPDETEQEIGMEINQSQEKEKNHSLIDLDEDMMDEDVAEETKAEESLEKKVDSDNKDKNSGSEDQIGVAKPDAKTEQEIDMKDVQSQDVEIPTLNNLEEVGVENNVAEETKVTEGSAIKSDSDNEPNSNLRLEDPIKKYKFDRDYFIEYLRKCNGFKQRTFKGKIQMTLLKVNNLMVSHVVAAKALNTFSDLAIVKWIKPGNYNNIKILQKFTDQLTMYQNLVKYLLQVDGQEDFGKWESLLNDTQYVLPSNKKEWANIFGFLPELCSEIQSEADVISTENSSQDKADNVSTAMEKKSVTLDVNKKKKVITKKAKTQNKEEIHTVFELDAVEMDFEMDFEMEENNLNKEKIDEDADKVEEGDGVIIQELDTKNDSNVTEETTALNISKQNKLTDSNVEKTTSMIINKQDDRNDEAEKTQQLKIDIDSGNEPRSITSKVTVRKPNLSSGFKKIMILGRESHRQSFRNIARIPNVTYKDCVIPFEQDEEYTELKSEFKDSVDTLWIIVADLSALIKTSSFCKKHFAEEKCKPPLYMFSLNNITATEKCTIAAKFVQDQLEDLNESSSILLIPSVPQTGFCSPSDSDQLLNIHQTMHSSEEARGLPLISPDADLETFIDTCNSFEMEWLKTVQSVMKMQSLNEQELLNYMRKNNSVMEKINDPQKYQGCGKNFNEWQKFLASLIRQMKSNAAIIDSSKDQPSPSTGSEKIKENSTPDKKDTEDKETEDKKEGREKRGVKVNALDVFGRPKRCGFCNCIVHLIEDCPGRLKALQRGYNGRKPLHTNFVGRKGKIVECKYCLSITHRTNNCPYIGRPGFEKSKNESKETEKEEIDADKRKSSDGKDESSGPPLGKWQLTLTHASKHVSRIHIENIVNACVEEGDVNSVKRKSCGRGSRPCPSGGKCDDKQCLLWHSGRKGEDDMEAYVIDFSDSAIMHQAHSLLAHLPVANIIFNVFYSGEIPQQQYQVDEEKVSKMRGELDIVIHDQLLSPSIFKKDDENNLSKEEIITNNTKGNLSPTDLRLFLTRNQNAEDMKSKNLRRLSMSLSPDRLPESPNRMPRSPHRMMKSPSPRRRSRSPHRVVRSPHRVTRSPHRVTRSPHRVARSPHRVARSPHRIARSPHRISRSPHRIARSPHRLTRSPHRMTRSPHRMTRSPHRITRSPHRIARSPHRIARSPHRITRSPHRIARSPPRITRSPQRVTRSPRRVVRSPYRVVRSPQRISRRMSISPHRSRSPFRARSRSPFRMRSRSPYEITSRNKFFEDERSRSPGIRRERYRSPSPIAKEKRYPRSDRIMRSRSPVLTERVLYRSPDHMKRGRSPEWDIRRSRSRSPERRRRSGSPRRVKGNNYGYQMPPKETFYEIEFTFGNKIFPSKNPNKRIALLLTQILWQCGGVNVIEKQNVFERIEGAKNEIPKRLIYKFKKRSTAHIVAKYFDDFRIPDKRMSCSVIGEEGGTFKADLEEKNQLIMTLSQALKTNQNLFAKHLQEIGAIQGLAFANNIFSWRTLSCKEQARRCRNFKNCPYFHGKGDKRRDLRQVKYTDAECKQGEECPKGEECNRAHNKAESIFHPKRIHRNICQEWYAEKKCARKDGVCISAHPESPEVLFNDIWKDLYVSGLKKTYQYLVGAMQNLRFLNTRLPGVYVLVLTPNIYMAHWLAEAISELAQDHSQEVAVVIDDYSSIGSARVVIGTPSSCISLIRSGSCEVLRTLACLIIDDASVLLKDHRMDMHTIAQMLSTHTRETNLELNRVVVSDGICQWEVDVISSLLNSQFVVLGNVIPETETEPMPACATEPPRIVDDRYPNKWASSSSSDRQEPKHFGFDPSSVNNRSWSPPRISGVIPSAPMRGSSSEMSRVSYSGPTTSTSFNAEKTIMSLNSVCVDMGVIGHSLKVILAKAEGCIGRPADVIALFREGDSIMLMELVEAKLKSLEEGAVGIRQAQAYKEALTNTRYLLQQAKNGGPHGTQAHPRPRTVQKPKANHGLDIGLISMVTLGKDRQYIHKFIKNSLQLENIVPNERNVADVYDLVKEKQEEMNSKSSGTMSSNPAYSLLNSVGNNLQSGASAPQQSIALPPRAHPEARNFPTFDSRLMSQGAASQSRGQPPPPPLSDWQRSSGPGAASQPEFSRLDSFRPDLSRPGTSRPDSFGPGTSRPDSFGPGTSRPDSFGPGTSRPDSFGPGTSRPDSFGPGTSRPDSFGPGPSAYGSQPQMLSRNQPQPNTNFAGGNWQSGQGNNRNMTGGNQENLSVDYGHNRNDGPNARQSVASGFGQNMMGGPPRPPGAPRPPGPSRPPGNVPPRYSPYDRSQNMSSNQNSSHHYPLFGSNTERKPWI